MAKISNDKVPFFALLFGNRFYDTRDFEEFESHFIAKCYYEPLYLDYYGREINNVEKSLEHAIDHARRLNNEDSSPIVIFPILTKLSAIEAEKELIKFFAELRAIRGNVFVYPIIWDGSSDCNLHKSGNAVHLFINTETAVANGAERLSEYIQRIMGYDRPDDIFPEYDMNVALKIARHINHEDFNTEGRRSGAVPKYPFRDGEPHFPALYVKVKCPECGKENEVYRGQLNKKGGAEVLCRDGGCYKTTYFLDIGQQFEPWPEFEEFLKQLE